VRILVTGATGLIGRVLVPRLVADGHDVCAYVRRGDSELRAVGATVVVGDADDAARLGAAFDEVHTVIHLVGGLLPRGTTYDWLNAQTTEATVRAAVISSVRRVLLLSFPGADPTSANEYLAAKGRAEAVVCDSRLEHAIFRCPQVVGPTGPLRRYLRRSRWLPFLPVPGSGSQRVNPVAAGDVAAALMRAATRGTEVRGTWGLGGPDVVTFDEFVDLAVGPKRKVHLRRLPGMPRALSEIYGADAIATPDEARREFGLDLTPLHAAIRIAAPRSRPP
jgi:NADH dehydrogenase